MEESRQTNTVWFAFTAGRGGKMDGLDLWSPNVNIFRAPRWRQCQETKVEASPHYWTHGNGVRHQAIPTVGVERSRCRRRTGRFGLAAERSFARSHDVRRLCRVGLRYDLGEDEKLPDRLRNSSLIA